jgi:dUTP pyrophosphatase
MNSTVESTLLEMRVVADEGIELPAYKTAGAAGMDLCCAEDVSLEPMERRLVSTGLRIAIPEGYEGQVRPRSGLAIRHGLTMVNTPGTIDSDYRGEVGIILINLGQERVDLSKGERIAQLVICPVARAAVVRVDSLDETERGEGGFGSTGR